MIFFDKNATRIGDLALQIHDTIEKNIGKLTDARTYDPTALLEKLLAPVVSFAQDISDAADAAASSIQEHFDAFAKQFKDLASKLGELAETWGVFSLKDWLPDTFGDWRNLNRSGRHYFYDPLVLDLNGNGRIDTLGIDINNRSNNAFFDFDGDNSQGMMALAA